MLTKVFSSPLSFANSPWQQGGTQILNLTKWFCRFRQIKFSKFFYKIWVLIKGSWLIVESPQTHLITYSTKNLNRHSTAHLTQSIGGTPLATSLIRVLCASALRNWTFCASAEQQFFTHKHCRSDCYDHVQNTGRAIKWFCFIGIFSNNI